jgi:hypothetical protein
MKREDIEEIQEGKKDEVEKLPEKKQKLEDKKKEGEVQTPEIFADPTYDITFKMLFGSDKNQLLPAKAGSLVNACKAD